MAGFEPESSTWRHVKAHVETRLADARIDLENLATPPDRTAGLRMLISELNDILDLANPSPDIPAEGNAYN